MSAAGAAAGTTLRVAAVIAPMHAEPRAGAEQISQRLAGHWVTVLEPRDPWLRVRGDDRYEGWIHAGYLRTPAPGETLESAGVERISLGCTVVTPDGARRAIPLGAVVPERCTVRSGEAVIASHLARHFAPTPAAAAHTAAEFFAGTPYLWGGITPWGADCSGLVQTSFGLHGIAMPRDAWQQATVGADAPSDPAALEPGDRLFFSDRDDGRVTHVGIALGDARMVHLALGRGGYAVERLDRPGDHYVDALLRRFVGARRGTG